MNKKWKKLNWGDCDRCGGDAEVFTNNPKKDWVYDDEKVRCLDCGLKGATMVMEDEGACISWDEFDEEE